MVKESQDSNNESVGYGSGDVEDKGMTGECPRDQRTHFLPCGLALQQPAKLFDCHELNVCDFRRLKIDFDAEGGGRADEVDQALHPRVGEL